MKGLRGLRQLERKLRNRTRFVTEQRGDNQALPWIIVCYVGDVEISRGQHRSKRTADKRARNGAITQLREWIRDSKGFGTEPEAPRIEELPQQREFRERYGDKHPSLDIGHLKEAMLVDMFNDPWAPDRPPWLKSLRLGSQNDDHQGVDLIAKTDTGDMPIQIKSSAIAAELHSSKSDIPVFVYTSYQKPFDAYHAFLRWLERTYQQHRH